MSARLTSLVAMLVLCAGSAAGADLSADSSPAKLWAASCAYCHDNGVAPAIFGFGLAPTAIAVIIRSGLNGMPAFHPSEITDAQLQRFAEWIAQQPASVKH